MATLNLKAIQSQVAALKAAGAESVDPAGFQKLIEDLQHAIAAFTAAKADGKITLGEGLELAGDAITLANDIAELAAQIWPKAA